MRKFQLFFGLLMLSVLYLLAVQTATAQTFDERLCVPMDAIAQAVAQHQADGKDARVENAGEGVLRVFINNVMTVWAPHPSGAMVWCMQEHLGGQGA